MFPSCKRVFIRDDSRFMDQALHRDKLVHVFQALTLLDRLESIDFHMDAAFDSRTAKYQYQPEMVERAIQLFITSSHVPELQTFRLLFTLVSFTTEGKLVRDENHNSTQVEAFQHVYPLLRKCSVSRPTVGFEIHICPHQDRPENDVDLANGQHKCLKLQGDVPTILLSGSYDGKEVDAIHQFVRQQHSLLR